MRSWVGEFSTGEMGNFQPALTVLFMVASVVILPAGPILRTRGVHSFRLSPGV